MLKKYYSGNLFFLFQLIFLPDFICEPQPFKPYNITLSFDFSKFPSGEDKEKTKAIHAELIQNFADKLSRFRRNFYAAPFEKAFEGVKAGKATPKAEYACRPTEKVWIIPGS